MEKSDFWKAVYDRAPEYRKNSSSFKEAFKFFWSIYEALNKKNFNSIYKRIELLADRIDNSGRPLIRENDLARNEYFIDIVSPIVENVRLDIFGISAPPFNDLDEAGEWVYRESKRPVPEEHQQQFEKFQEFLDNYQKARFKGELWSCGLGIVFQQKTISFPGVKRKDMVETVLVRNSKSLLTLANAVKQILSIVDFDEYAITAHILTGIKPRLPRYRIDMDNRCGSILEDPFLKVQLVLKINTFDLTFNELRYLYSQHRKLLSSTSRKRFLSKQLKVFRMVQEVGGVPETGVTQFWKQLLSKWNAENPNEPYKTWEAVFKAYTGINKKMSIDYSPENVGEFILNTNKR